MADIWQQTLNWQPNSQQQQLFQQLYELILSGNRQLNLTRITSPDDFWEKHLWDSLRGISPLMTQLPENSPQFKIIDIGTGGGFPGIPAAITLANSSVMLLDSTRKKVAFLENIIPQLNLTNVTTATGRAEVIAQEFQHRNRYDVALTRAVSTASVCAEYSLPLLKPGGLAIIYRGNWTEEENQALEKTAQRLNSHIEKIDQFTTPLSHSIRHCLHLRKGTPRSQGGVRLRNPNPLSDSNQG
ncbi:16S rRNA (guanine(527)-N(7))-methyltransferase RsmG [Calothrix sp. PCC 6303]|uniref:16S rRNA (guanine(527)-N(7))-methyltransferase RsmG n=1 Tax=Calothrix sp. PCC 6303 TaxID=1170562 RepID=UPI0002A055B7|nr:16S rRNA (guanine(527)-N(7))-methyltransferase RsmG [Calothrix sp. PCC 6303]AFZ02926.1 16S rRNA m(7)G-527 methyltransferase [Calothrix sp. PCC 6303]